jgi:hypothetical protein
MHIPYQEPNVAFWVHALQNQQIGGSPYFVGNPYQRGHGLGTFFQSLFRFFRPVAASAGKAIGRAALAGTANVASDILRGKAPLESLKERARETAGDLTDRAAKNIKEGTVFQAGKSLGKVVAIKKSCKKNSSKRKLSNQLGGARRRKKRKHAKTKTQVGGGKKRKRRRLAHFKDIFV